MILKDLIITYIKLIFCKIFNKRLNGLIVNHSGEKYWYKNGLWHREDGPAVESANGDKFWHQNGKFHRLDGPAVEFTHDYTGAIDSGLVNGCKYWFYEDKKIECISQEEFERIIKLKLFW